MVLIRARRPRWNQPAAGAFRPEYEEHQIMTIEAGRARASQRDDPVVIDLVTRARDGDQQAWDALVERYAPLIWSVCRRNRLSEADAVDVGHSVWLQLADQLDRVRDPAALAGWLVTTTRRGCGRVLRAAPDERPQAAEQCPSPGAVQSARGRLPGAKIGASERHALLARTGLGSASSSGDPVPGTRRPPVTKFAARHSVSPPSRRVPRSMIL
jgi:hypothetical protein